jgi:hypothetical protein
VRTDGGLNGHFPLHTPGINAGAGASYSLRRPAAPYSLGRTGEVVLDDPHDPAVKRAWQQEQGIKADHDLQMRIADKGRFFTYCWDTETYPFGCALESRQRQAQRELFFELLKTIYPEWMLKGVAYGDVAAAMSKTAATLYNDDPMHKASSVQELYNMRLKRGTPFEQGVEALWDKVEDLEAMRCPVLGALKGNDLEIRKKKLLYSFLHGNPDFEKVLTDHGAYNYT